MSKLLETLRSKKLSLIVALPENSVELAKAAEAGGADAVKAHLKMVHRASGIRFGTLEQERPVLEEILRSVSIPVGIVPGAEEGTSPEELAELRRMGIDFVDMFVHFSPTYMLTEPTMGRMVAITNDYDSEYLYGLNRLPGVDMVEAAIMPKEQYGKPLTFNDVARYAAIAGRLAEKPIIVPSQKALKPADAEVLAQAGVKAIMIGVLSTGSSYREVEQAAREFRRVIDSL